MARVGTTAAGFIERCHTLKAKHICVFGTEALRQLSKARLAQLQKQIPELIVLDPAREAQCSLLAAAYGKKGGKTCGEVLAIDQGAASMELALGVFSSERLKLKDTASHRLGTQPLVEVAGCLQR